MEENLIKALNKGTKEELIEAFIACSSRNPDTISGKSGVVQEICLMFLMTQVIGSFEKKQEAKV